MAISRRSILKLAAQGSLAIGAMLVAPKVLLAAWSEKAFHAKKESDAMSSLFGSSDVSASDKVTLKAPEIAENGAVVPIKVSSTLDGVESISVFVEKNPTPLAASFELPEGTEAKIAVRIRMGKTSKVTAVVKAGGKLYSASTNVKVTIGGCGG